MTTESKGSRPERVGEPKARETGEDRMHVSSIVLGLIDARACHVDFFDTRGGEELARWYRRQRLVRAHRRH